MSRLAHIAEEAAASGNKLLIPYLVTGDPNLKTTLALMHELVRQGADVIELGIPFSDPSSDGPVIQRGAERALAAGTTLKDVLALVVEFRQSNTETAVVLMGYLNPIEIMGYTEFASSAGHSGVDGVLIVDMPTTEAAELQALLRQQDIDTIYLVAPTTSDERLGEICSNSSGYLYYVSLKGVTGAALTDYESVGVKIRKLRKFTQLPIVIGFGIKDAEGAAAMGRLADGVVIGSALVEQIAQLADQEVQEASQIKQATAIIGLARNAINDIK